MNKEEKELCQGCMFCEPYDYIIDVNLHFLNIMQHALETLRDKKPYYFAQGWLDICNENIKRLEDKYSSHEK